jgi:hypothetical protein
MLDSVASFGNSLARIVGKILLTIMSILLMMAVALVMALALEPAMLMPSLGLLLVLALSGIFLGGVLTFRGLARRLTALGMLAILACIGLHLFLLDGLFGTVLASLGSPHETVHSSDYSDWKFHCVTRGMRRDKVVEMLGQPLSESWIYAIRPGEITSQVTLKDARVIDINPPDESQLALVKIGVTSQEVLRRVGPPIEIVYAYTRGRNSYCVRLIHLRRGRVSGKISYYHSD